MCALIGTLFPLAPSAQIPFNFPEEPLATRCRDVRMKLSDEIARAAKRIEESNTETLAAVKAGTRQALAAAAIRELRDTQRHGEMLSSNRELLNSNEHILTATRHLIGSIDDGFRRVADQMLQLSMQLERIAGTLETPRATQAKELRAMAIRHFNAGKFDEAEKLLRESLGLDATVPATYVALAFTQYNRQQYDESVEALLAAVPYAASTPDLKLEGGQHALEFLHHMIGRIRLAQGRFHDAVAALEAAGQADRNGPSAQVLYHLIIGYALEGEPARALAVFEMLIGRSPRTAYAIAHDSVVWELHPYMNEMLSAAEARRHAQLSKLAEPWAARLEEIFPHFNEVIVARRDYDESAAPGPAEASFYIASEQLGAWYAFLEVQSGILVASPPKCGMITTKEAEFEAEAKRWQDRLAERVAAEAERLALEKKRRRRRRNIRGVVAVLLIWLAFGLWEQIQRNRPAGAAPAPVAASAKPANQAQLGQKLAGLMLDMTPAPSASGEQADEQRIAQENLYFAITSNEAITASRAVAIGAVAEVMRRTDEDPDRYSYLQDETEAALGRIGLAENEVYRRARGDKRDVDTGAGRVAVFMLLASDDMARDETIPEARREAYRNYAKAIRAAFD